MCVSAIHLLAHIFSAVISVPFLMGLCIYKIIYFRKSRLIHFSRSRPFANFHLLHAVHTSSSSSSFNFIFISCTYVTFIDSELGWLYEYKWLIQAPYCVYLQIIARLIVCLCVCVYVCVCVSISVITKNILLYAERFTISSLNPCRQSEMT